MSPKFSIIVPVFNTEVYLEKCVDSILNQTFIDFELILIDDGSTDDCGRICDSYAEKDDRVRVIHKKNEGVSVARNTGIDLTRGEYLTFIDSDDWIDSNMLSEVNEVVSNTESDSVITGLIFDYSKDGYAVYHKVSESKYGQTKAEIGKQILALEINSLFGYSCSKFYRSDLVKIHGLRFNTNISYMEDLLFNCEYFMLIKSIYTMENSFYHYMIRDEGSLSSKFTPELFTIIKKVRIQINKLFSYYDILSNKYPTNLPDGYISGIKTCIHNMYHENCNWTLSEKNKIIKEILEDKKLSQEISYFEATDYYSKLFLKLYKTKNIFLINTIYTILFKIRNNVKPIYQIIRKRLIS